MSSSTFAAALAFLVAVATPARAEGLPPGLTADGWAQIQRAVRSSRIPAAADPAFVHDAELFGHGDPLGTANAQAGLTVAVSGDTLVVGSPPSAFVFVRSGTSWTPQQELKASDGGIGFGRAVSVSGDTAVVGALYATTPAGQDGGTAYVFVRSGGTWTEQQKLLASDGAIGDHFGQSVAISGDTVMIGAPAAPGGAQQGKAYFFVRSGATWTEQQWIAASDAAPGENFGWSVSVSGDSAVIGAPSVTIADQQAGKAYVFVRSGSLWSEEQKLDASSPSVGDVFGWSVAISGDTATVGAPRDKVVGDFSGSAYAFVRSGTVWTEQRKFSAEAIYDQFGWSVSLSGDTLVVGAATADTPAGIDAGSAYVFARSGASWDLQEKLTAPDGQTLDQFAYAVAIDGDTLAIGAPFDDVPAVDAGSVHVFVRSGTAWSEQQKLLTWDPVDGDLFGRSVATSGDTVVVGAPHDRTSVGSGSVSVFVRSGFTWSEQQKLLPSDGLDSFGSSVAISGDTLVVGAREAPQGTGVGAAYVFVRSGAVWTEQQKLTVSGGLPNDYFGGSVAISGDTVVIGADGEASAGEDAGAAYVFVRSGTTWTVQQRLTASNATEFEYFGYSVSISGDTVAVGAPALIFGNVHPGQAYAFVRSGTSWTQQQRFTFNVLNDQLGCSVSISGDTLAVGAIYDVPDSTYQGSAAVYLRFGTFWSLEQKLTASDAAMNDFFGQSLSLEGDILAVAAPSHDGLETDAGQVYLFGRSGTTWTEKQKLTASDPGPDDHFGNSVSLSAGTLVVGVQDDDLGQAVDAGSAHIFGDVTADLDVTVTDSQASAVPGEAITYSVVVSNAGPHAVPGATVADVLPMALQGSTWACSASGGSSCGASGSGDIDDSVSLLVGGTATYALTSTIDPAATGSLVNTATVVPPLAGSDSNPANNSATDTDTLTPVAEVSLAKSDGQASAVPGQLLTYTIKVPNAGPSNVSGLTVTDVVPAGLLGATWSCSPSAGSTCTPSGAGSINDSVNLASAGGVTYRLTGHVDPAASGALVNTATATVPPGTVDPDLANNAATDSDALLPGGFLAEGELAHGYDRQHDLAALPGPVADEDVFRISQNGHTSFEVLLDGASGDIGVASGPMLDLLASDASTVILSSAPAGAGGSRSLRWMNASDQPVADQFVRVRSAGCTTDCDAADVYRLKVRETTGFIPRFNNSGTQITVLVLENAGQGALDVDIRFWGPAGAPLGGTLLALGPRQTSVLNTSTIAPGSTGSITVANTGHYGQLSGKAVAVEPGTGFTFDTALELRAR